MDYVSQLFEIAIHQCRLCQCSYFLHFVAQTVVVRFGAPMQIHVHTTVCGPRATPFLTYSCGYEYYCDKQVLEIGSDNGSG